MNPAPPVQSDPDFLLEILRSIVVDAIDSGWKTCDIGVPHDEALVSLMDAGEAPLGRMARTLAAEISKGDRALDRVRAVLDEWDRLSKGETTTTARIRAAINGRQA